MFYNIFIGRLWRCMKDEEVSLHDYQAATEAVRGLSMYFEFYHHERPISLWTTAHQRRCTVRV